MDRFAAEQVAASAASDLASQHTDDFVRLFRGLVAGAEFQLWIAVFGDRGYRDRVIQALDRALQTQNMTTQVQAIGRDDASDLLRWAAENPTRADILHLTGAEEWDQPSGFYGLNLKRESLANEVGGKLVLWVHEPQLAWIAGQARDLWSWRAGVVQFVRTVSPAATLTTEPWDFRSTPTTSRSRAKRMAELREWLNRGDLDDDRRAKFLDELAQILLESGQTEAAIAIRRDQELPLVQRLGDEVEIAFALGNLSFALQTGGHTEASIAMLRDRVLPAFDRLRQLPALCLGQIRLASALLQVQRVSEATDVITKQAIPIATFLDYSDLLADANSVLSACLAQQGRYKEAIGVLESVIASWESQPTGETKLPTAQSQLGHYLTMVGQLDKAGPLLEQAAADLAAQTKVAERTQALYRLARVYELQGQLSRALQVLREQAMPVATAVGDAAALGAIADLVKRLQAALANQHDQLE